MGRTAILKRHEDVSQSKNNKAAMNCRNPKYSKAARGRAALQKWCGMYRPEMIPVPYHVPVHFRKEGIRDGND